MEIFYKNLKTKKFDLKNLGEGFLHLFLPVTHKTLQTFLRSFKNLSQLVSKKSVFEILSVIKVPRPRLLGVGPETWNLSSLINPLLTPDQILIFWKGPKIGGYGVKNVPLWVFEILHK